MKKLSQKKRIIIGCIAYTLLAILGIIWAMDNQIDSFSSYLIGLANGFLIYKGIYLWESIDKEKS